MDYGKFKYEAQKKANAARKKQKVIEVKEIKMRPSIDQLAARYPRTSRPDTSSSSFLDRLASAKNSSGCWDQTRMCCMP